VESEVKMLYKALARNKSDTDAKHKECRNQRVDSSGHLNSHDKHLRCIAEIVTVLIENLNIQMETETADMLDRRMMQLFGVAKKGPFDKGDMLNMTDLTR